MINFPADTFFVTLYFLQGLSVLTACLRQNYDFHCIDSIALNNGTTGRAPTNDLERLNIPY